MNKKDLVEMVAKELDKSKAEAEKGINAVIEAIKKGLKKDSSIQLIGFGTFVVRDLKARTGRNPQTGAEIKVQASKTVRFKPGKALKDSSK